MRMDHALAVAAGQAPGPDQILSVAGRLTREAEAGTPPQPPRAPAPAAALPGNLATLRACQALLGRTVQLLG
jgi:hypothetical protein